MGKKFNSIEDPDGNVYEIETDETLEKAEIPADAAAVGKRFSQLSQEIADEVTARENAITDLKAQGVQQTPLFANDVSECTDTTKLYVLPDGYFYAYVKRVIEGNVIPNFTNQLPISTDTDGSIYNEIGYKENTYISTGVDGTRTDVNATGFIPIGCGSSVSALGEQVIRLANAQLTAVSNSRFHFYDSDKVYISTVILGTNWGDGNWVEGVNIPYEVDENGYLTCIDVTQVTANRVDKGIGTTAFVRVCGKGIDSDTIITVNEEITYTTVEDEMLYEWKNTGRAFVPTDYEDRIVGLETENKQLKTDLASAEQRIVDLENAETTMPESETVPQAVIEGASDLVDKVLSRADANVIRFVIYSDAHQNNENELITKGNKELGQAIGEVVKQIGVDFISGIGDYAWASYANTSETVKGQIKQFNRFVNPYIKGEQIMNTEGNHDDAVYSTVDNDGDGTTSSTEKLSLAETYSLIYAKNKGVVYDAEHYIDGYCYKDFEHLAVRVIVLNAEQGTGDGGFLEGYQLKWFAETALNVPDNINHVITLAHHPFSYSAVTLRDCANIINAFISRDNFSYSTNDGTAISVDYSDKNCQYVGHFHGHAHAYSIVKMQIYVDGIYEDINAWEICIPNACYSRNNQYVGNANERLARYSTETTYNKSDIDGLRTSFNLITVDLDEKIIYADNYGAGIDRQVSYSF